MVLADRKKKRVWKTRRDRVTQRYWIGRRERPRRTILGRCPLCKQPVPKRVINTLLGEKPTWVQTDAGDFYHIKCWRLREKSRPKTINIKYQTSPTPLGQIDIERKEL